MIEEREVVAMAERKMSEASAAKVPIPAASFREFPSGAVSDGCSADSVYG